MTASLPDLVEGALPLLGTVPTSTIGAIHRVSLAEVARVFCTSRKRVDLMQGLLKLRDDLRAYGLVDGVQWIDGSFIEERREPSGSVREPQDIDVVTYAFQRQWTGDAAALQGFLGAPAKLAYGVDHYIVPLDAQPLIVQANTVYWYELWSARRAGNGLRKGFIQVPLAGPDTAVQSIVAAALSKP